MGIKNQYGSQNYKTKYYLNKMDLLKSYIYIYYIIEHEKSNCNEELDKTI